MQSGVKLGLEGAPGRILLDDDGTDMRALARSVVHEAGERYGYKDDMTVLAIRLEERK